MARCSMKGLYGLVWKYKVIVVVEKLNEVTPKYCTDTYCNDEIV